MATASTRFANLNYWIDVKTGFDYLVQLQVPPLRMEKPEDLEILPIESVNPLVNLMIRDVATVRRGTRPGQLDRSTSQRYLSLTANVEGEDMGRASSQVAAGDRRRRDTAPRRARRAQGPAPADDRDVPVAGDRDGGRRVRDLRAPDRLLPVAAALADLRRRSAGVLAGIATILYFTNTTLNIESFMGSIMSLGVSVSNSVMLVTFIDEHWKRGVPSAEAAVLGASERLRPIFMTACAMTVGMVPMALALERGSQMQAPLGLAVIGGLVMSTFATLLVVPSIFAVVIGNRVSHLAVDLPGRPRELALRPERLRREWPCRPGGRARGGSEWGERGGHRRAPPRPGCPTSRGGRAQVARTRPGCADLNRA